MARILQANDKLTWAERVDRLQKTIAKSMGMKRLPDTVFSQFFSVSRRQVHRWRHGKQSPHPVNQDTIERLEAKYDCIEIE